jgi:hypothetical protein
VTGCGILRLDFRLEVDTVLAVEQNPELSLMTSLCRNLYLEIAMLLDLFYIFVGLAFFVVCWLFTKACDHL